jgi:hypothetical protein
MFMPMMRFRHSHSRMRHAQPPALQQSGAPAPHWRRGASVLTAHSGALPPILATLVLVQSVARGELKAALAFAVVLALLAVLAFAIFWWPRIDSDEEMLWDAPAQNSRVDDATEPAPHVLHNSGAQET